MAKWDVEISDSAWYPEIEAETAKQAKQIAWEWFIQREPTFIVKRSTGEEE